jgi:hypothetical protein
MSKKKWAQAAQKKAPPVAVKAPEVIASEERISVFESSITTIQDNIKKATDEGASEETLNEMKKHLEKTQTALDAEKTILAELTEDSKEEKDDEGDSRTFVEGQYLVKANLKYLGKIYRVGESVTIEKVEIAEKLVADGTIE